jgi:hypothetical protein
MTCVFGPVDDLLDARVEARNITATRKYTNS